ncbi:hypothetical protein V5P93_001576 [Actinokineospora auranticolor]|uniref:Uncharacterized protein n=1 Tax=Actinokineospora auranticolor TaxID=155976 RepID=A0A2S6GVI3_9PSEU|nr:hypothetical protein [Actinokineospora auranticolor]PPK69197.1 hypothetical protein CLV40_104451 [Actinokineospora auranticolor]
MAVDRALWWSVWWPWAMVWILTALGVVVALGALFFAWRAHRARPKVTREVPGLTFYLHEKSVMDLYQSGGYGDAMRREVEERVDSTSDQKLALKVHAVGLDGGRSSGREVVSRYITNAEPIAVIGVLLDVLENADGVVHVDLRDRTITHNNAVSVALLKTGGTDRLRLRSIDSYVSVRGAFRVADHAGTRTVFLAPFGDPDDPEEGPQVRLECHKDGLRDDEIPDGPFHARCLGKVQAWKSATGELVVRPIAIFQ